MYIYICIYIVPFLPAQLYLINNRQCAPSRRFNFFPTTVFLLVRGGAGKNLCSFLFQL